MVRRTGAAERCRTEGIEAERPLREESMLTTDEGGVVGLTLKSTTCSTICPREGAAELEAEDIVRMVEDLGLMRNGRKAVVGRRKAEEGNGFRWSI